MKIKFKNWEKYQPRKDIKRPWYFSFDNTFFLNSKLYALDNEEKLCLIYLLCEASRENKNGEFQLIREHYRVHSRLPDRVLSRTLKKLQELQTIEQPRVRGMYVECEASVQQIRLEEIREEKNIKLLSDSASPESRRVFDFDSLYKKYPRKEGKQKGLAICKVQIKTPDDFDLLSKAIDRYCDHLKKHATDPKFIKMFSTFMNSWRDWIDPETGTSQKPAAAVVAPRPLKSEFEINPNAKELAAKYAVGPLKKLFDGEEIFPETKEGKK